MKSTNLLRKTINCATFLMLAMVVSGCAEFGRVNGGGWLENHGGGGTSNFGFNANGCDAVKVDHEWVGIKGRFNFIDQSAYDEESYPKGGVKIHGTVTGVAECEGDVLPFECNFCEGGYAIRVDYDSTNPFARGNGQAKVCVYDNGEGINAVRSDWLKIFVMSGPFEGYYNGGYTYGNIQAKACKLEDEEI